MKCITNFRVYIKSFITITVLAVDFVPTSIYELLTYQYTISIKQNIVRPLN